MVHHNQFLHAEDHEGIVFLGDHNAIFCHTWSWSITNCGVCFGEIETRQNCVQWHNAGYVQVQVSAAILVKNDVSSCI